MNVLIIGSGGREHALAWKIKQSPLLEKLSCIPGNPGIEEIASCTSIPLDDFEALRRFAIDHRIDLTVVGPEKPLAGGVVDYFEMQGLKIFGPTKQAAQLEWSKAFAKEFMRRHGIPTARYQTFRQGEREAAIRHLKSAHYPVVLKADGLAAGKGVIVCHDQSSALEALRLMMEAKTFGATNDTVVVEEFLVGEEVSVFAVCDGKDYRVLSSAQDHKRALDGDEGLNTGGMGAYAPAPVATPDVMRSVRRRVIEPTLSGMAEEGRPYKGCLYVGLMVTEEGPKVVEYNSRFGDPETQVILPLFSGDLLELMVAACEGRIGRLKTGSSEPGGSAVCVVLVSGGYPGEYQTGKAIRGLDSFSDLDGLVCFHAGTKRKGGEIVTAGGRVLGVTAISKTTDIERTIAAVYRGAQRVSFEGMHYRHDIGKKALMRLETS